MSFKDLPFLDVFLIYYLVPFILIIGGIGMLQVKQNEWFGLRTPATLSDPEVWDKANKVTAIWSIVVGIVLLPFNITSYLLKWPIWIQISLMIVIPIGLGIFGLIYSDRLKLQKNDITDKPFIISKSLVYAIFLISIFTIFVNISVFFVFLNSFIAVRICGMVVAILGIVFSILFLKDASLVDKDRTKNFEKHFLWFTIFTILWSLVSVGLAYVILR
ncbi:SdpI family protein [Caldisericum exile]|uniref:Hypothetical membrane protein n=1 Tax=Caldisericum exile (strain DSM 21853 / NBRC 104410 / AZM16c01) TaxID=511051 RepID=A0A7U6GD95_CALEA|nr:SdpI family protein [Caldisericum exile]BAL80259.1 hypothetical membrane protein [Caldisericum exile AZM16c01]